MSNMTLQQLKDQVTDEDRQLVHDAGFGNAPMWRHGNDLYVGHRLLFHWALLKNPVVMGGQEDRHCYFDVETIERGLQGLLDTGELMFWHKWHTKNLTVNGSHLYPPGVKHEPQFAIDTVPWVVNMELDTSLPLEPK
ncbi:hypothetical protein [Ferrimonas marina]|uniref:Uncharacterized protein n=1 Tax=Ferrimonas marina TaxID=299255 RepID=A0A1M5U6R6_9GAMM|nr:hypothetical protein [Ferrimonas marina]SHH58697.1 hypothetical protein SAMN02745129_2432 [Ferrimonas marina]